MATEQIKKDWPKGTRVDVMAGGTQPQYRGVVIGYGRDAGSIRIKRDFHRAPETWPASCCRKSTQLEKA
jgi:hypothetical protein